MMSISTLLLIGWLCVLINPATTVEISASGMVRYLKGNRCSNVVITAGHGGVEKDGYADRPKYGCYNDDICEYSGSGCIDTDSKINCKTNSFRDLATSEIAMELAKRVMYHTSYTVKPHVILCDLHRSKVDVNRDLPEATFGNPNATQVYNEYHSYVQQAIKAASLNGSRSTLYIDVHGQAGNCKNIIGHLLDNNTPTGLRQTVIPDSQAPATSLAHLFTTANQTLEELVRGNSSIGGLMERHDPTFQVIPSPKNPRSLRGKWYRGGFSLRKYTLTPISVSGIQVEVNSAVRKAKDEQRRTDFADTLGKAVADWLKMYY